MQIGRAAFAVSAVILALGLAVPHQAQAENKDQRAALELFLDQVDKGPILVILRGKEILASVSDLEQAGIKLSAAPRATIDGTLFVPLASLASAITYQFDETNLALNSYRKAEISYHQQHRSFHPVAPVRLRLSPGLERLYQLRFQ